jgi:hypothetical protein
MTSATLFRRRKRGKVHALDITMRTLAQTLRLKQSLRIATAARIAAGRGDSTRTSAAPRARRAPLRVYTQTGASRGGTSRAGTSRDYAARRLAAQVRTRRI